MGTYNYLVIPDWKIKIATKVRMDEEGNHQPIIDLMNYLEYENYDIEEELEVTSFGTMEKLIRMYSKAKKISCFMSLEEWLLAYLELKGINYVIISEYDEKEMKKYEKYLTID